MRCMNLESTMLSETKQSQKITCYCDSRVIKCKIKDLEDRESRLQVV